MVITDFVLVFVESSPPHNSQRIDANTDATNNTTKTTHTNTTKLNHTQTHHPFPAQIQAHLIPNGTRLAQLCQNSCFLHDAKVARPTGKGPLALTASQSRVYRESQLDERSLSLSLRTETQRADWRQKKKEKRAERRERERRKRTKEQRKKKERSKGKERERETPVCRFKTPPCGGSKRLHVYGHTAHMFFNMCAWCRHTQRRFEPPHGRVLNLHTGFSACQAAPHTTPHTQHTPRTHTQTLKHKTHIPHAQRTVQHTRHHHAQCTPTTLHAHTTTRHTHATHTPHTRHTLHTTHQTHQTHHTHTNAWTRARRATDRDLETKK